MEKKKQKSELEETPKNVSSENNSIQNKKNTNTKNSNPSHNYKEKYIRLYAEFENFRKRTTKESQNIIQYANKNLIEKILPIIDDLQRVKQESDDEGINLILNKFIDVLKKEGTEQILLKKGDDFDTDIAEAITTIDSEKHLIGKVVDVVEKGYKLNNKVIRFAKVIIGK